MTIEDRLKALGEHIAEAALRAGRDPGEVKLIAVTKSVDEQRIREAIALGVERIGENRVQELLNKYDSFENAEKHLIGQLQTNKVKKVVGRVDLIHSVDRLNLAREIHRCAAAAGIVCPVLIQVNLGQEPQKGGVSPEELVDLAGAMLEMGNLKPVGLMTVPPICPKDEARRYFAKLRRLLDDCNRALAIDMTELSMGMSSDYCEGILEGATFVRIGTALFGRRL
ncbi:MAG: YggS family pyridoxal phosphate-dependent enzyme [Christensenellales bacterium]|jgi:pyridoxal phosphate enzyme (YggS family)